MLASAIPTTDRSSKAASSSAPGSPKALDDGRVGTLRELPSQRAHGTGSLVDFRFIGQEGGAEPCGQPIDPEASRRILACYRGHERRICRIARALLTARKAAA